MNTHEQPETPSPDGDGASVIAINLTKVRTALSLQHGTIIPEVEARLWVVRAGFMPRSDERWTATPGSTDRLRELLQ